MKKFFYLMSLCLCMFAGAAVMTSCGDDDDIDDIDDIKDLDFKTGITDKGNTLVLQAKTSYFTFIQEATFDGSDDDALCTKFIEREVYTSDAYANAAWEEYKNDEDWAEDIAAGLLKKDGKTIIWDETADYKGSTKAQIRSYMESMKAEFDAWGD